MKRFVRFYIFMVCLAGCRQLYAQADTPTHMIRIYEDDDCINLLGQVTDNAYTNGTRIDYFYMPQRPSRFFIDKVLPRAGSDSRNVYGWGIMQIMYTPDDLTSKDYQPNDYPYSGALFATHALYSYNAAQKYAFQTEIVAGVIGPAALAKETQRLVHRWEGFDIPEGWGHQFRNDLLFNINFTAEKQLAAAGQALEIIGGSRASVGTMQNSIGIYPLIRIGNMRSYFDGFLSQYTGTKKKGQFYFFAKPEVQLVFSNALVQGGLFTHNPNLPNGGANSKPSDHTPDITTAAQPIKPDPLPYPGLNRVYCSLTYGAVFSTGNFGLSFSQITSSAQLKGLYCHTTGNVSVFVAW